LGEPAEQFALAKLHREAPVVSALDVQSGTGTLELSPGAAVTVRAADTCAVVSNDGGRQGECALAVDAVSAALGAAGFRVVHYSAFAEQRALPARATAPAEAKKHEPNKPTPAASEEPPKPSEAEPSAFGVEQVFVVDEAAVSSEQRASADSLTLFSSDVQGHERAPLPASSLSAQLSAFAVAHPMQPFSGGVAELGVSVVAVQDGRVSFHYGARAREQAALVSERAFLFRIHDDAFEPTLPVPVPALGTPQPLGESTSPNPLFERLGKDLTGRLRAATKVGY
jgi:hypothetical protein